MGHVYVKLGLDQLSVPERRKELFQRVCRALEDAPPPEPTAPSLKPELLLPVPRRVNRMVVIDEPVVIKIPQQPVPVQPTVRPRVRMSGCVRWLVLLGSIFIMVMAAVIVGGYVLLYVVLPPEVIAGLTSQSVVEATPPQPTLEAQVTAEEQVVAATTTVPAATFTQQPTDTPSPSPTNTPAPTNTLRPTNTPRPQPTNTPVGFVSAVFTVSGEESGTISGDGIGADPGSWYSTGTYIEAGDQVDINYAGGEWWIGRTQGTQFWPQTATDAGGYVGREEDRVVAEMQADNPSICYELQSAPIGSLIGRIEDGPAFFIGNNYQAVSQFTGILFLRINYNSRVNFAFYYLGECPVMNGGAVSVRVKVIPQ